MLTGCWVHWPVLCSVSRGSATHPGMFVSASSVLSDANTHSHTHIVMAVKLHLSSWSSHRGKIHYQKNPHKNLQWFMRWRYFSRSVNILLLCEWDWRSAWIHTSQTADFFLHVEHVVNVIRRKTLWNEWTHTHTHTVCRSSYREVKQQRSTEDGLQQDQTRRSDALRTRRCNKLTGLRSRSSETSYSYIYFIYI